MTRNDYTEEFKPALNAMFAALKKTYGFDLARQNFLCCASCGCAEVSAKNDARVAAGRPPITKWTFYHSQDAARLDTGSVYLVYGDTVAEGEAIRDAALNAGLAVEWDGTIETRVHVFLPAAAFDYVADGIETARHLLAEMQRGTYEAYDYKTKTYTTRPLDMDSYQKSIASAFSRGARMTFPTMAAPAC